MNIPENWFPPLAPTKPPFLWNAPQTTTSWLCYGCGSAQHTLLVPTEVLRQHLDQMSASSGNDRHYWHVVIHHKDDRFVLRLLGAIDGPDLTAYLASTTEATSNE